MPGRRANLRTLAALTLASLVAAGCGARLTDEQMQAVTQQPGAPVGVATPSAGNPADPGAAPVDVASPTTLGEAIPIEGAVPTSQASGGTQGESAAGPTRAVSTGPCRPSGGATDKGVSDSEVRIGSVATISGPVPGLSQTAINGVKAYVAYTNGKGGVCGRRLRLVTGDDRLDTGANRSEHERLKDEVFAFVGSFSPVDDGGATVLDGTNIPDVTLSLSDRRNALANNFSPQPLNPKGETNGLTPVFAYFKSTYTVTKAGVVYPAQAVAKDKAMAYVNDMKAAGLDVAVQAEVAITQTDYNGVATQLKNAGVEIVITALETTGMARLAQAFKQQNYAPKVPFYGSQAYGRKFVQQAGAAAEGTIIGVSFAIPEDPAAGPGTAALAQWYPRANPAAELDYFSIMGWVATDMFVKALTAAGPTPTRDKVLQALRGYNDFTADGAIAPRTDPAGKNPSPCFLVLGIQGGKWKRLAPASGFAC